jgi:hypothetical protein
MDSPEHSHDGIKRNLGILAGSYYACAKRVLQLLSEDRRQQSGVLGVQQQNGHESTGLDID